MFALTAITDNKNHEFLCKFLKENCRTIKVNEVQLTSIIGTSVDHSFLNRLKTNRKIRKWVQEHNGQDAVLIFSDYAYAYRMLVHFCSSYGKPIFLYQDGFIIFEPWPKNFSGIMKRLVYQSFNFFGYGHLISYLSFNTHPTLIFSWGDFFTRIFKYTTSGEVINVGTFMYAKNSAGYTANDSRSAKILYYCTFFREADKNTQTKASAVENLKGILRTEKLTCDIKLHPLDHDQTYIKSLLLDNSMSTQAHFLENDFLLHKSIGEYRFIISEFSTETLFASIFCSHIYFIKNELTEKHFMLLKEFLKNENIGGKEFYQIDQSKIDRFQTEYFQKFNIDRFEQAVQAHR